MNPPQKLASALVALALAGCNGNQLRPIPPPDKSTLVTRLSELGIFASDPKQQRPRAEFVAYDVNVARWCPAVHQGQAG